MISELSRLALLFINDGRGCRGCGACVALCPTGALTISRDRNGNACPVLNPAACRRCGRCRQACDFNRDPAEMR